MPIDPKWVRNQPGQVGEWQKLRGREAPLEEAAQADKAAQGLLLRMNHGRRRLKELARALRPDSGEGDRDGLRKERGALKEELPLLEAEHRRRTAEAERLLWCLASPVDEQVRADHPEPLQGRAAPPAFFDWSSPAGWKIASAFSAYAHHYFGTKYHDCHSLPGNARGLRKKAATPLSVYLEQREGKKPGADLHNLEQQKLVYALWGCRERNGTLEPPAGETLDAPVSLEALWWLAESVPRKSIFGAKQLPQFSLLRRRQQPTTSPPAGQGAKESKKGKPKGKKAKPSRDDEAPVAASPDTDSIQLIAMAAGSTFDARQVQLELVRELKEFYESLLATEGWMVAVHAVLAPELELHEHSRLVLSLQQPPTTDPPLHHPLGSVSNFGDAASRACEFAFKGGGLQDTKSYVHLVHASILHPSTTLPSLVTGNSTPSGDRFHIPTRLHPYLVPDDAFREEDGDKPGDTPALWMALASGGDDSGAHRKKKAQHHAAPIPLSRAKTEPPSGRLGLRRDATAKMALLERSAMAAVPTRHLAAEAASCPFGFLLSEA